MENLVLLLLALVVLCDVLLAGYAIAWLFGKFMNYLDDR